MSKKLRVATAVIGLIFIGFGSSPGTEPPAGEKSSVRRRLAAELKNPVVVEDLGFTAEQTAQLAELEKTVYAAAAEATERRRKSLSSEELAAEKAKLKAAAGAAGYDFVGVSDAEEAELIKRYERNLTAREFERRADAILTPEQLRRSKEIFHRLIGPAIFSKHFQDEWDFTIDQKLIFDEALQQQVKDKMSLAAETERKANLAADDASTKAIALAGLRKIRVEDRRVITKWIGWLTPQQQKRLAKLRGKPFDLDRFDQEMLNGVFAR